MSHLTSHSSTFGGGGQLFFILNLHFKTWGLEEMGHFSRAQGRKVVQLGFDLGLFPTPKLDSYLLHCAISWQIAKQIEHPMSLCFLGKHRLSHLPSYYWGLKSQAHCSSFGETEQCV